MKKWAIFYDDFSVVTDANCKPEELTKDRVLGIQVIATDNDEVGRALMFGHDYYWWEFDLGVWNGGNAAGVMDYIYRSRMQKILMGRSIPTERFREIYSMAANHSYLPRTKSAWRPEEKFA